MSRKSEAVERLEQNAALDRSSAEKARERAAKERQRPSVLFRPKLTRDGDQWSALYGPNIQVGCAGFGDTPEEAMQAFDRNWQGEPESEEGDQNTVGFYEEVDAFVELMNEGLAKHDEGWGKGWKGASVAHMQERLREEVQELDEVMRADDIPSGDEWEERVAKEAADVANIAMMLADLHADLADGGADQ